MESACNAELELLLLEVGVGVFCQIRKVTYERLNKVQSSLCTLQDRANQQHGRLMQTLAIYVPRSRRNLVKSHSARRVSAPVAQQLQLTPAGVTVSQAHS
jgi:hypothetical protein